MDTRQLAVPGAVELTPRKFDDDRGTFLEWFKDDALAEALGHRLRITQANCSVSSAGVVRGIHYADVPPSQAKYVTCISGSALDVVVDLRVGSPAFGTWDAVVIDDVDRRAVYLPEGVGHAFMALTDPTTIVYLCSENYAPQREHGIDPFDETLAIAWPEHDAEGKPLSVVVSDKDAAAPSFAAASDAGALPSMADVEQYVEELRSTRAP